MSTELVRVELNEMGMDSIHELEARFAVATRQRELLERYIKDRLVSGKHYYVISQGQKPSLTKDGAELVCLPHGYKPAYEYIAGPQQPPEDDTPYQITVRCRLMRDMRFEGDGIGSASSHITNRDGERKVRMRDIGLRHNATFKMAQKSAYIAATLNATAASEFFTQDMEDAAASEPPRAASPQPSPAQARPDRAAPKSGDAQSPYWCIKHKTLWTKKTKDGKSWYSHKDGQDWCNMPEQATTPAATPRNAQEGTPPPQDDLFGPPTVAPTRVAPTSSPDFNYRRRMFFDRAFNNLGYESADAVAQAAGFKDAEAVVEGTDLKFVYRELEKLGLGPVSTQEAAQKPQGDDPPF